MASPLSLVTDTLTNPIAMLSSAAKLAGDFNEAAGSLNQQQPGGSQFSSSKESKDDGIDVEKIAKVAELAVCLL